ncbi:MAG: type II toxin-antitoxin system CcdA family antitoxin [Pseudomonadota bacterium]
MPSALNIRDLGGTRKSDIEAEARRRGISVADIVREYIDAGLARTRAERERAAWVDSAKAGLADEAEYVARHGPALAQYRRY